MFGLRVQAIPTIQSYAHAERLLENTTPIRGCGNIPIGNHKQMRSNHKRYRMHRLLDGSIGFVYHNTIVLKVYPCGGSDDTLYVVDVEGWHTKTTAQVLSRLLPLYYGVGMFKDTVVVNVGGGHYPVHDEGLRILKQADGTVRVLNPKIQYTHQINRKKADAVRSRYREFLTYARTMLKVKVQDGYVRFHSEERKRPDMGVFYDVHDSTAEEVRAVMRGSDMDAFYPALLAVLYHSGRGIPAAASHATCMTWVNTFIMKSHAAEVLDQVELPLGVLKEDKYKDWVRR